MVQVVALACMELRYSVHFPFYRPRAQSGVIQIAFQEHEDEPEANLLFAEMANYRDNVSRSLGELI